MLRHVALLRTDGSEERMTSIIKVTTIGEPRTTLLLRSSSLTLVTLMMEVIRYSETSILTRATLCNIPEDAILIVTAVETSNRKYD
jgi:hypothetical protein